MRTIDADLLEVYQSGGPTIVVCVTVTRMPGTPYEAVFRWIALDIDLPVEGYVYSAAPGVELSQLVSTEGFAVDNGEWTVLEDLDITRADILAGLWDGAEVEIAEVDYKAAAPVKNVLKKGKLGNFKPMRGHSIVEFRDLRQPMQGAHETPLQETCRYADTGNFGVSNTVSHCPVDLATVTVTGTLTGVTSQYRVTDSARTEPDDYFGNGRFRFTFGTNAGMPDRKIKTYSAGVFTFWDQFIYPIGPDDQYEAIAGCRGRFTEDCKNKFGVEADFGGENNKKNPDVLTAPGTPP